jgi:hypothetical protein
MNIPILQTKDGLIEPQDVAVVFSDSEGNCRLVETSPSERHAFARKIASNRQWQSKRYVMHDIVMLDREMAGRIYDFIASQVETNDVAKAIMSDIRGEPLESGERYKP